MLKCYDWIEERLFELPYNNEINMWHIALISDTRLSFVEQKCNYLLYLLSKIITFNRREFQVMNANVRLFVMSF